MTFNNYRTHANDIEGWYNYTQINDILEIINRIHTENNVIGNVGEIGIFHGKSFIPLALLRKNDECAVAIDCFGNQRANLDHCGEGNLAKFKKNCLFVIGNMENIIILEKDSQKLNSSDISGLCNNGHRYRIFSIDGCHTLNATYHDLMTVSDVMCEDGVIILDDYFNNDWPGVKAGVDKFLRERDDLKAFYIGWNKLMLCRKDKYDIYSSKLISMHNNEAMHYYDRCVLAGVWK